MTAVTPTPQTFMYGLWVAWAISWWAAAIWSDRSVQRPARRHQLMYRALAASGAILLFGMYRRDGQLELTLWRTPDAVAWGTLPVAALGMAFTWWARIHLGRLWSSNVARKATHYVVETGPYGIVRHPIYTGITVASIATAVMRGTVAAWLGVALMTLGWYIKARMEEGFLQEQLGADAYASYARRVPMLVPFVRPR
jgi:protein-S-isoprenylcysteine O-methyltransferase Ste14